MPEEKKTKARFDIAVALSLSIHMAVLFPFVLPAERNNPPQSIKTLLVDYIVVEESSGPRRELIAPQKVEISKSEPTADEAMLGASGSDPQEYPKKKAAEIKPDPREENRLTVTRKDRREKYFNHYYQAVRDKIKTTLRNNYIGSPEDGEVYLVFTLLSDGSINRYHIDEESSTQDRFLIEVAELSLVDAAPFPKFPNGLPQKNITFNVVVSFKGADSADIY
ncbi:MAG: hypothetical protein ABIJ27_00725 [Candidatus Omnitrophota bacterium]